MARAIFSDAHRVAVDVIVAARKSRGLAQTDLAKALGRDQSVVSHIERNQRGLDIAEFYDLARGMGIDPIELFSEVVSRIERTQVLRARDRDAE